MKSGYLCKPALVLQSAMEGVTKWEPVCLKASDEVRQLYSNIRHIDQQDYDKERKARELIEEVCVELAKEIGEDKAEVEALKRESMKLREELEDKRKMLQMAEVWCEECVQMKLVDAKVALENKYSQMNKLVAELETFLQSSKGDFGESNDREIEQCGAYSPASHASKIHTVSPEVNAINKDGDRRHSNSYADDNVDIEDDESGWETMSYLEDQGSSCSPEGSAPSIRNRRDMPTMPLKKVSSIARLWRSGPTNGENYKIISVEGMKGRLSNGRLSNVSLMSSDRGSGKGDLSPPDLVGQWSSPESGNPHITRGMKGCIEWPRGAQKKSLKAKLMEARMESQVQLRHVLKQKI
ncbi:hypothetical protein EZV62_009059 [Acer yangbiense]|uniref:GTD-binding domain-containing protein n=1 Tax=Acer yangbiense TaxID=1000413 RepID=A0A5C7IFK7_9ROSI|nr:hypothetical protein EZV62_009059 [Acer yangbiense]